MKIIFALGLVIAPACFAEMSAGVCSLLYSSSFDPVLEKERAADAIGAAAFFLKDTSRLSPLAVTSLQDLVIRYKARHYQDATEDMIAQAKEVLRDMELGFADKLQNWVSNITLDKYKLADFQLQEKIRSDLQKAEKKQLELKKHIASLKNQIEISQIRKEQQATDSKTQDILQLEIIGAGAQITRTENTILEMQKKCILYHRAINLIQNVTEIKYLLSGLANFFTNTNPNPPTNHLFQVIRAAQGLLASHRNLFENFLDQDILLTPKILETQKSEETQKSLESAGTAAQQAERKVAKLISLLPRTQENPMSDFIDRTDRLIANLRQNNPEWWAINLFLETILNEDIQSNFEQSPIISF